MAARYEEIDIAVVNSPPTEPDGHLCVGFISFLTSRPGPQLLLVRSWREHRPRGLSVVGTTSCNKDVIIIRF